VARSGFYAWQERSTSKRAKATRRKKKRALCGFRPGTSNLTTAPRESLPPDGGRSAAEESMTTRASGEIMHDRFPHRGGPPQSLSARSRAVPRSCGLGSRAQAGQLTCRPYRDLVGSAGGAWPGWRRRVASLLERRCSGCRYSSQRVGSTAGGRNGRDLIRLGPVERPEERDQAWCVPSRSGERLLRPAASVVPRPEALDASRATLRVIWPWPRESSPDGRIHRTEESGPNHHGSTRVPKGATDL